MVSSKVQRFKTALRLVTGPDPAFSNIRFQHMPTGCLLYRFTYYKHDLLKKKS